MFMLVFAAIGVFGAGMLAIAAGIPIKDFGYGNTLILSGVMAWCTSAIMLTLWACLRELKKTQPSAAEARLTEPAAAESKPAPPSMPPGWPEAIPERAPAPAPPPAPAPVPAPAAPAREPRRNLLFTSTRRPKDSGARDITAPGEPTAPGPEARPAPVEEPRPPVLRRPDSLPPRTLRPATLAQRDPAPAPAAPPPPPAPPPTVIPDELTAAPPAAPPREAERPGRSESSNVSVLKSGVVDGMAYWLYSDGSIEAQMPEGMMRFSSIDELRAHLDKRP